MIKQVVTILTVLLTLALLVFLTVTFEGKTSDQTCKSVIVSLQDEEGQRFVSEAEVRQLLQSKGIRLKDKPLDRIDYAAVENTVKQHRLVQRAECYPCPSGTVCIAVWQHIPVMRIFAEGSSYYLDANGAKTGLSTQTAADVPVATGAIHDSTTLADLFKLACLLQEEPAWDALIEQIVVYPDGEWLLVPRVGDFDVHFGRPVNMETKLKRLAVFMSEYLPKMGWETYSSINLKYDNQIVCTRKKT